MEFTSDGAYLLWAGHSGNINVWDVGASRLLRSMKGHPGSIAKLVISPNGDKVAVSGVSDGVVSVWDLSRGTFLWAYVPPIEGMSRGTIVLDLSFTPDGQHLIYADGVQVVTRDALTGELAAGTDSLLKNAGRATFSRDHKFLALLSPITGPSQHAQLGGGRETARRKTILTVKSGDGIRQLDSFEDGSPGRSIEEIVFAPTGQHLAVLEQEIDPQFKSHRVLRIWPVKDIESSPAVFDASGLKSFSFSKDGQFIFASLTNGVVARITLLDNSIMKFTAETNPVSRTVTPNPDGTMLVAAGEDALLRVWKMDSEKVLCSIAVLSDGTWLAWSTDGRFDTNSLDKIDSFAWLMPDDPDRSLPAELYIRDYYSPKLVAALASGGDDALGSIRSIEQLNRARPRITNIRLIPEDDSQTIMAKVDVEGGTFEQAHNKGRQISGAYDLR
ncbi:MAG: WD40 repeat domain-containing protein, partial [Gammaproteobacteria bacterium]|nr:WD40 repeat domain-containing protein [Gammaproteobacteria bacterium]